MKYTYFLMAASVGMLVACSGFKESDLDEKTPLDEGELVERVIFEVPELSYLGEDGATRASAIPTGTGVSFGWEATDTVGIYPDQGAQVFFSMADGVGSNSATFDGGGWRLRKESTYSSYYPFVGNIYLKRDAIPVSFLNQEQVGLSGYDGVRFYLASQGESSSEGTLKFEFQYLNTVICVKAIGLPAGTYTKLSLTTDDDLFVQEGTFGLEDFEHLKITGKTFSNTLEISLKDFILSDPSTEANPVVVYLTSAPVDLSGHTVIVRFHSEDGVTYRCKKGPFDEASFEAGAMKSFNCSEIAKETVIYYTSSDNNPVTPFAENAFGDGVTIIANEHDGTKGILTLNANATEIGDNAFKDCVTLTGITIPETVTRIGDYAFSGCINLAADNTSANMTRMMYSMRAPFRSGESSFVIPESVTSIGEYAFQGCTGLTSITIPDGVTTIKAGAFQECTSLTSVTIPDSVTTIEEGAFRGCTGLTSITIPDSVTTIEEGAFQGCTNLSDITIPNIDASTIHTVFDGAGITSVTIAEGVTSIADEAFKNCEDLISVKLPSTLTRIGDHAFEMCSSLTKIIIPGSVIYIGSGAFLNCSNLPRINLPSSTTKILDETFAGCLSLSEINLPSGLTSIGNGAFDCCHKLPNIVLPDTVTEIGSSAFSYCDFTTFTIPQGVERIQYGTFYECSYLSSIRIPDSVESIDMHAFYNCVSLTSVVIPDSVTRIENGAFQDCAGLSYITVHAETPPSFAEIYEEEYVFAGTNNCLIYVPSEKLEAYKTTDGWSNYASRICDHVYVDMGNGMKWATTNVGAVGPDDLGQYFAWGGTVPLTPSTEDPGGSFTDTAKAKWGGYWRMPTSEEWEALLDEDHYEWAWDSTRKGYTVTSKVPGYEGHRIFLPAAGCVGEEEMMGIGWDGNYWSSSPCPYETWYGWGLIFEERYTLTMGRNVPYGGWSVRPIYESNPVGDMENLNDSGNEVEI